MGCRPSSFRMDVVAARRRAAGEPSDQVISAAEICERLFRGSRAGPCRPSRSGRIAAGFIGTIYVLLRADRPTTLPRRTTRSPPSTRRRPLSLSPRRCARASAELDASAYRTTPSARLATSAVLRQQGRSWRRPGGRLDPAERNETTFQGLLDPPKGTAHAPPSTSWKSESSGRHVRRTGRMLAPIPRLTYTGP
jgi:hypothetical protein